MSAKKIVWVLGAGFSRSLGGPLLTELFTDRSRERCQLTFPQSRFPKLHDGSISVVTHLYKWGRNFPGDEARRQRTPGRIIWSNAEEYIDYLDAAVSGGEQSSSWRYLTGLCLHANGNQVIQDLRATRDAARRLLVAECSEFLQETDTKTEKWQPYLAFSERQVKYEDTIITFNYDCVLETIKTNASGCPFAVQYPTREHAGNLGPGVAPVLKLHGSVDWSRTKTGNTYAFTLPVDPSGLRALTAGTDDEIIVATPGPSKRATAQELRVLWDMAGAALRAADVVIFIGYRFPPTDSEARYRLLKALGENGQSSVLVHTVLGPSAPESPRLRGLLEHTLQKDRKEYGTSALGSSKAGGRRYKVMEQPLYAEDFLSVFDRDYISEPPG